MDRCGIKQNVWSVTRLYTIFKFCSQQASGVSLSAINQNHQLFLYWTRFFAILLPNSIRMHCYLCHSKSLMHFALYSYPLECTWGSGRKRNRKWGDYFRKIESLNLLLQCKSNASKDKVASGHLRSQVVVLIVMTDCLTFKYRRQYSFVSKYWRILFKKITPWSNLWNVSQDVLSVGNINKQVNVTRDYKWRFDTMHFLSKVWCVGLWKQLVFFKKTYMFYIEAWIATGCLRNVIT